MKKQILNIGQALNKAEQKEINGGGFTVCNCSTDYIIENVITNECSYPALRTIEGHPFPGGRCLGTLQNNMCC